LMDVIVASDDYSHSFAVVDCWSPLELEHHAVRDARTHREEPWQAIRGRIPSGRFEWRGGVSYNAFAI
jgi:hypothetical protein